MGLRRSFKPTNLVQNGGINTLDGWTLTNAVNLSISTEQSIANNSSLKSTPTASNGYVGQKINITAGLYYVRAMAYISSYTAGNIFYQLGSQSAVFNNALLNQWQRGSWIRAMATSGLQDFFVGAISTATCVAYFGGCMIIEIASLPDEIKAMSAANQLIFCDSIPWFDGTMRGGSFGGTGGLK